MTSDQMAGRPVHDKIISLKIVFIFLVFLVYRRPRLSFHSSSKMSKLNATAYEFVPGKRFGAQQQQPQPQQPPPPPFSRPEEPDVAPPPPPTISLNIGGSKPSPAAPPAAASRHSEPARAAQVVPPPAAKPPTQQVKAAPTSSSSTPTQTPGAASPAPQSKTFTMGRAKTDTAAIAQEVATVADQEVLEDLFGDSALLLNS